MMSFFTYFMGSKKGYMESRENFYYGIHMKCDKPVHHTQLECNNASSIITDVYFVL